jgi:flagellar basal body rod protein FlgG
MALQTDAGVDLTLTSNKPFQLQADGTVIEDGQPTARIGVVDLSDPIATTYADGGVLSAPSATVSTVDAPEIRQGAYESSNVSSGAEMTSIMLSLRQAETGQKLVNVYDDLMGRIIESFGQTGGS